MNIGSFFIIIVSGILGAYVANRSLKSQSQQFESKMLDYLKTNSQFTINQFAKEFNLGFFAKGKARIAASMLVNQGKINCEIPASSSAFNRDETVRFFSK